MNGEKMHESGIVPISEIMPAVYEDMCEELNGTKREKGLESGFPELDEILNGLHRSDLIFITARPGMGKTSFALDITTHVGVKLGKKVAFYSLEADKEHLVKRLLAINAAVPYCAIRDELMGDRYWQKITDTAKWLSKADIYINDKCFLTVPEIEEECSRIKYDLIIVDCLQLISTVESEEFVDSDSMIEDIVVGLKNMALGLAVPVICLIQASRCCEKRDDKRPAFSDLRELRSVARYADVIISLYREGYYTCETDNPNLTEVKVMQNRKGNTGTVMLEWSPEYCSFSPWLH